MYCLKKQHKWVYIISFPIYANGLKEFKIITFFNNTPNIIVDAF